MTRVLAFNLSEYHQAKLAYFGFIGDPASLPNNIRSTLEKQNIKLAKYLNRLPWKFNFYADTEGKLPFDQDAKVLSKIPRVYEGDIKEDNGAINLVYGNVLPDGGDLLHAPTPWIILHSLCHAVFNRSNYSYVRAFEKLLGELYKKDFFYSGIGLRGEKDLAHAFFTFRSARKGTAITLSEALLDFYTQILVNGMKADMVNPIPETVQIENEVWTLKVDQREVDKLRKTYLKDQEKELVRKMNKLVGKYAFV